VPEVERLAVGGVASLHRAADLVGRVRIEEDAVGADLQRLEGRLRLRCRRRARDEVRLLADPRDQVLKRDDRPVLADDDRELGVVGGLLGEALVLGAEHPDVHALRAVVAPANRREVRGARQILGHVDGAVSLAALPDEVGVGLSVALGVVDHVRLRAECGDRDVAQVADAAHVRLVDQYPVRAGLDGGRDPSLARLPVADIPVGFHPDRACHCRNLTAGGLENCERVGRCG